MDQWAQAIKAMNDEATSAAAGYSAAQTNFAEQPGAEVKASKPLSSTEDQHLAYWEKMMSQTSPAQVGVPSDYLRDPGTRRHFVPDEQVRLNTDQEGQLRGTKRAHYS